MPAPHPACSSENLAAPSVPLHQRTPPPTARSGDKWHLDEVFIKVNGRQKYLWRAVDQDGNVLDVLVQNRRDKAAAGASSVA